MIGLNEIAKSNLSMMYNVPISSTTDSKKL